MADQREIDGDVVDPPLGHQHHDSKAEDRGMVLVEARFLGHRMLLASLALERAVADEIEDAILGWREDLQHLLGKPPQPGLRAPLRRAQQASVVLIGEMGRALPGKRSHVGPLAVDQVQHQELPARQMMPMVKTGFEHP